MYHWDPHMPRAVQNPRFPPWCWSSCVPSASTLDTAPANHKVHWANIFALGAANSWRCHTHFIDDLGTGSLDPGLGDPQLFLTLSFQQTHSMLWTIAAFPRRCEKKCKSFHLSILPINWEVLGSGLKGFMSKLLHNQHLLAVSSATPQIHYLPPVSNNAHFLMGQFALTPLPPQPLIYQSGCASQWYLQPDLIVCLFLLKMIIQGFLGWLKETLGNHSQWSLILLLQGFK